MQKLIALLITAACLVAPAVVADTYSTEATLAFQKDEGTLDVVVRVSRLLEPGGQITEQVIAEPKIHTALGVPANLYSGLPPSNPNFAKEENFNVEVSWPYPNESGTAFCAVTIRRGDKVVSKSKMQLKVEGPGRTPLILAASDVDPKSVRVDGDKGFVLLEFSGKTRQEVKRLAVENYGNKVQIRDLQGRLIHGGLSFGTYHETGLALSCADKTEAEQVAGILRRELKK